MTKNNDIQALRGIAILLVMVQHYAYRLPTSMEMKSVFDYFVFWGGVDLFFVISGYVITRSLIEDPTCGRDGSLSASEFYTFMRRRLIRLLPAAWFWILVGGVFFAAIPRLGSGTTYSEVSSMVSAMLGVSNFFWVSCLSADACPAHDVNSVHWSLSFELQFYLVFALATWLSTLRKAAIVSCAYAVGFTIYGIYQRDMHAFSLPWVLRPQGFAVGIALGFISSGRLQPQISARFRLVIAIASVFVICSASRHLPLQLAIPVIAALSGVVVWLAIADGMFHGRWGRVLAWVGDRSYSVYLSHLLVFHGIQFALLSVGLGGLITEADGVMNAVFMVFGFGIALLVGSLSRNHIELPVIRWHRCHVQKVVP